MIRKHHFALFDSLFSCWLTLAFILFHLSQAGRCLLFLMCQILIIHFNPGFYSLGSGWEFVLSNFVQITENLSNYISFTLCKVIHILVLLCLFSFMLKSEVSRSVPTMASWVLQVNSVWWQRFLWTSKT